MKSVLFVINSLTIGGSEKSLVSLLNMLDYTRYKVDLLMFKKGEEFDKYIPKEVNVLHEPEYYKFLSNTRKDLSISKKINYMSCRIKTSINLRRNYYSKNTVNDEQVLYKSQKNILKKINNKYDVAIAYSQGMPTYFVVDKVNAKKKLAWINCDYATTKYDKEIDYQFYKQIDNIIAVSDTIRKSIVSLKPDYEKKIEVILDIVNPKLIEKMSLEEKNVFKSKDDVNILTVARLVIHHKGYDLAVKAAKLLKDDGYKFKWYVVGEGEDRENIEKLIEKLDVKDCFILLGSKGNPYPYMRECDIYVQPSKREGFGLTVVEAKILRKPIVCTEFNTASELISNNLDGLIVNIDENSIYKGIKEYIGDTASKNRILNNLKLNKQYTSVNEINKLNKLFN